MALPPEPIAHLLPKATWIVEAEVVQVLSEGPQPPLPAKLAPSAPLKLRAQTVELKVKKVVRGPSQPASLTAQKPEGSYLLKPGHHGPFLLDGSEPPLILGRYGPDTYSLAKIEAALS